MSDSGKIRPQTSPSVGCSAAVRSHSWNLAELCYIACFISTGMCLFMIRGQTASWRANGREKKGRSCDDPGCTIISWVKHHGQVFISSPGLNYTGWFHERALPCPGRSSLRQCFMGAAVYFHIFHGYAQTILGLANKIMFGFARCFGHIWRTICEGHYGDVGSV